MNTLQIIWIIISWPASYIIISLIMVYTSVNLPSISNAIVSSMAPLALYTYFQGGF